MQSSLKVSIQQRKILVLRMHFYNEALMKVNNLMHKKKKSTVVNYFKEECSSCLVPLAYSYWVSRTV